MRISGIKLLLIEIMFAIVTALFIRVILILITAPHSVITFWLKGWWLWPVAVLSGVIIYRVIHNHIELNHLVPTLVLSLILIVVGVWANQVVLQVDFMNHLLPGFWVK